MNAHCDTCVRTRHEWWVAPVGHTSVTAEGIGLYHNAPRGKQAEPESVQMAELRAWLLGAVRELGAARLRDGYETAMRASLEWVVGSVDLDEVWGYVCDEVQRVAGEFASHGATAGTSAGHVGHVVDLVTGLGDGASGAIGTSTVNTLHGKPTTLCVGRLLTLPGDASTSSLVGVLLRPVHYHPTALLLLRAMLPPARLSIRVVFIDSSLLVQKFSSFHRTTFPQNSRVEPSYGSTQTKPYSIEILSR